MSAQPVPTYRTSDDSRSLFQEKEKLEKTAQTRKKCIKLAACLCTIPNACYFMCCRPDAEFVAVATNKEIVPNTTCGSCCWEPARPSESPYTLLLDPFVICFCCAKDRTDHFLYPEERIRLRELQALTYAQEKGPSRQEMSELPHLKNSDRNEILGNPEFKRIIGLFQELTSIQLNPNIGKIVYEFIKDDYEEKIKRIVKTPREPRYQSRTPRSPTHNFWGPLR